MKVKCRGFKGNLISLNPTTEITELRDRQKKYLYTIEISIDQTQEITISGIRDEDIEFIKEEEEC